MNRHRNSQKRIYVPGAAYFCTTNTYMRHAWFEEPILHEVLAAEIKISQQIHSFKLFGYAIMPDHLHIMFRPIEGTTYSDIMKSIKKQSSHEINRVMGNASMRTFPGGAEPFPRHEIYSSSIRTEGHLKSMREHDAFIRESRVKYIEKHGTTHPPIKFKWHKSFHDHYIRNAHDFINHIRYIERQESHHEVKGTVYVDHSSPEGEKAFSRRASRREPFSRLQKTKPGNLHTHKAVQEPHIELIARAVGSEVLIRRF